MNDPSVKDQARELIEDLPEDADWDELMRRIYVRQAIEAGYEDSEAGRTVEVSELIEKLGLTK